MKTKVVHLEDGVAFYRGYMLGLRQPSLMYGVQIEKPRGVEHFLALLQAVDKKWRVFDSLDSLSLSNEQDLLEMCLKLIAEMLKRAGQPLFDMPVIETAQVQPKCSFHIVQPCIHHYSCWDITKAVIGLLNEVLTAATRPTDQLLDKYVESLAGIADRMSVYGLRGFNMTHFLSEAVELGIPRTVITRKVYQLGQGVNARLIDSSLTDKTPSISVSLCRNKTLTVDVLRQAGLPVPQHVMVNSIDKAVMAAEKLGYPIVLKPFDMDGGDGVFCGLHDAGQVKAAFAKTLLLSKNIIVEKQINGKDYRIQVVNGDIHGVLERVPGGVTGNGADSVKTLVEQQNVERAQARDDRRYLHAIKIDLECDDLLNRQDLSWDSVPVKGRFVRLRWACNVAGGGVPVPTELSKVHSDNVALAQEVCQRLRLDVAGIDLIIPDISLSWQDVGGAICEVNAKPQMFTTMHRPMLKAMFPDGQGRLPSVVVLSETPDNRIARQLHELLNERGLFAGMASSDGALLGKEKVRTFKQDAFDALQAVISSPLMEFVVLSMTKADLLKGGWPLDVCDFMVIDYAQPDVDMQNAFFRFCELSVYLQPKSVFVHSPEGDGHAEKLRSIFSDRLIVGNAMGYADAVLDAHFLQSVEKCLAVNLQPS